MSSKTAYKKTLEKARANRTKGKKYFTSVNLTRPVMIYFGELIDVELIKDGKTFTKKKALGGVKIVNVNSACQLSGFEIAKAYGGSFATPDLFALHEVKVVIKEETKEEPNKILKNDEFWVSPNYKGKKPKPQPKEKKFLHTKHSKR